VSELEAPVRGEELALWVTWLVDIYELWHKPCHMDPRQVPCQWSLQQRPDHVAQLDARGVADPLGL
jgi:hypothetical protein